MFLLQSKIFKKNKNYIPKKTINLSFEMFISSKKEGN